MTCYSGRQRYKCTDKRILSFVLICINILNKLLLLTLVQVTIHLHRKEHRFLN